VRAPLEYEPRLCVYVHVVVAGRLLEIGNFLPAGELFRDIQQFKPALEAFMKAGAWDRARDLARTAAPQFRCVDDGAGAVAKERWARVLFVCRGVEPV
jgi:hypothetical protein